MKRVLTHQWTLGPDVWSRHQVWTLGIDLPTRPQVTPGPESILLQKGKHLARVVLQIGVSPLRRFQLVINEAKLPKLLKQLTQSFPLQTQLLLEEISRRRFSCLPSVVKVTQHIRDYLDP